jgi:hypothetical protein
MPDRFPSFVSDRRLGHLKKDLDEMKVNLCSGRQAMG